MHVRMACYERNGKEKERKVTYKFHSKRENRATMEPLKTIFLNSTDIVLLGKNQLLMIEPNILLAQQF